MAGLLYRRKYREHVLQQEYSEGFTVHHNGLHTSGRALIGAAGPSGSGAARAAEPAAKPEEEPEASDLGDEPDEGSPSYTPSL